MSNRVSLTRRGFTFVELLAVVVIIAIVVAFLLPTRRHHGGAANRVKCASNLRQIGQAMMLYANDNRGAYPRVRYTPSPLVVPVYGTGAEASNPFDDSGPKPNDVTAAMFLLVRTQDMTPEIFICPTSNAEKDTLDGKDISKRSNFTDYRKNLSYSLFNPYFTDAAIEKKMKWDNTLDPAIAIAADLNPGVIEGKSDVRVPKISDPAKIKRTANSFNHDQDGQNVLYADGHAEFQNNVFVGMNNDNIYTSKSGKVEDSPADAEDSVLLPTAQ